MFNFKYLLVAAGFIVLGYIGYFIVGLLIRCPRLLVVYLLPKNPNKYRWVFLFGQFGFCLLASGLTYLYSPKFFKSVLDISIWIGIGIFAFGILNDYLSVKIFGRALINLPNSLVREVLILIDGAFLGKDITTEHCQEGLKEWRLAMNEDFPLFLLSYIPFSLICFIITLSHVFGLFLLMMASVISISLSNYSPPVNVLLKKLKDKNAKILDEKMGKTATGKNCYKHSQDDAVAICRYCGRYFCSKCLFEGEDYYYCKNGDDCLAYQETTK